MRDRLKYVWMLSNPLRQANGLYLQYQFEEALRFSEQSIARGFRDARMYNIAASSAAEMKLFDKAEIYWKEALAIRPNFATAAFGLGVMYGEQDRLLEAEACYRQAVNYYPRYAEAQCNLGNLYCELGRLEEADVCYRQAIAVHPEWANVRNNLSFTLLSRGYFEEGWALREARYDPQLKDRNSGIPPLSFPQWRGEPLIGKSIVLWDEQGFGDVIQFARYAKILRQKGAEKITFVCRWQLKGIFKTLVDVDRVAVLDSDDTLEPHDYWTFPLSIPLFHKTTLETIPADIGYISAPQQNQNKWQNKIPKKGFKVGLVWKGSTEHKKDSDRSLASLEMLRPLWSVPGVTFVSLQKGQGEDESFADLPLVRLGADIKDFSDTAGILEHLDLLISVDTAIVHLAGAMGKPVWVLVPTLSDWRWLHNREDSPWYPTLRLFRQSKRHEWVDVIERIRAELVKAALKAYVGKKPSMKVKA